MELYKVGGCVRDELLGLRPKDIDFTCVLTDHDIWVNSTLLSDDYDPYIMMYNELLDLGLKIFLETPEYFTIRARFPKNYGGEYSNLTADFVVARKESDYSDGRRPDSVEPGTLEDDLRRRDFTMNAIAQSEDGRLVDPFNGREDIQNRVIRAVGNPRDRFLEDALRAIRAMRFAVTKSFSIHPAVVGAMEDSDVLDSIRHRISDERIREELTKMFRYDTVASLHVLAAFPQLTEAMFAGTVSLDATMKTKGRGQ